MALLGSPPHTQTADPQPPRTMDPASAQMHPMLVPGIAAGSLLAFSLLAVRALRNARVKSANTPPVWSSGLPVVGSFLAFASDPLG
jgi:hypothetical protein